MALGKRKREQQTELWLNTQDLPVIAGDPFYDGLNAVLSSAKFDDFVEAECAPFYHPTLGQPGLAPGIYFRMLFVGFFEALGSESLIAWRCGDSFSLKKFLGYAFKDKTPDRSTLSKTRTRLPEEVHAAVFSFVLQLCAKADLLTGQGLALDASTIDANAALSSIRRRDSKLDFYDWLRKMAAESGVATPTKADLVRFDKDRTGKSLSNDDWENPHDPDAKVTKTKSHGTRFAYKVEHVVETGNAVIIAAQVHPAHHGDTTTGPKTLDAANTELAKVMDATPDAKLPGANVAMDTGYFSLDTLTEIQEWGFETFAVEPKFGSAGKRQFRPTEDEAVLRNRENGYSELGQELYRKRGETVERSFAHMLETGGLRRIYVRGLDNVQKRYSLHAAGYNLSVLLRSLCGAGTPRSMARKSKADRATAEAAVLAACAVILWIWRVILARCEQFSEVWNAIFELHSKNQFEYKFRSSTIAA